MKGLRLAAQQGADGFPYGNVGCDVTIKGLTFHGPDDPCRIYLPTFRSFIFSHILGLNLIGGDWNMTFIFPYIGDDDPI